MTRKDELFLVFSTYAFVAALLVGVYAFGLSKETAFAAVLALMVATPIAVIWFESETRARLREARERRRQAHQHRHSLAH